MPIRTRTHDPSPYFQTDEALKTPQENAQPVSIGSATRPVDWRRTQRQERTPLARPKSASNLGTPKKKAAPVVDDSDTFLAVFLPRPSVNLTRSSYTDFRPSDGKAAEDFKRPSSSRSNVSDKHRSKSAAELYKDGLAPDFEPIELVSVELLFNPISEPEQSPPRKSTAAENSSTVDSASIAPSSEIGLTEDRPTTPNTLRNRRSLSSRLSIWSSSQGPNSPSKRSLFGGKSKNNLDVPPPLPRSPSSAFDSRFDTTDASTTGDELLPPKPAFLRQSSSRKSISASSRGGSDVGDDTLDQTTPRGSTSGKRPRIPKQATKGPESIRSQATSPVPSKHPHGAPAVTSSSFKPKMTTILSRFSSRQMGDHKCRRGYPIAVFAGAQSMDVGSITNQQVEGSYSLFFGSGHPQNLQELMSQSELKPSHLQNPKPLSTAATARRAELIATTRALQAIHDLYQGKACAHVCMDSAYVAKAWGSWIPKWEEEGWPGDEHVKRRKDSGYRGSGSVSEVEEPVKRSSKRLADEDLLRQLAAIRRLYARAERKGTGAAHLYLIDKNVNPAHKTARQMLDNAKVVVASSPTQSSFSGSRRDSMTASRASMSYDGSALAVPGRRRQRSMISSTGSKRHSKRGSVDLESEAGTIDRERERTRHGRHRSGSMLKPAPPLQEETPSEVGAPSAAADEGTVLLERKASVKSAASAVTAMDEEEARSPVVAPAAPAAAPAASTTVQDPAVVAADKEHVSEDEKPDGILAAAAASAGAFLAGVTGYTAATKNSSSPASEKEEADAVVPDEPAVVPDEPKVAGLAPALNVATVDPVAAEEGELTAVDKDAESSPKLSSKVPVVVPLSGKSTKRNSKPIRAATTKEKTAPLAAEAAPIDRSKSVSKVQASKDPSSPSKGGRLINYSKREKKEPSNGVIARDSVAPIAVPVTRANKDDEAGTVLTDSGAPLASVVEDQPLETVPTRSIITDATSSAAASKPAFAKAAKDGDVEVVSPIKKRSSMPAVRQSVDGAGAPSIRSTSSKNRRFRTLSFLGGRKVARGEDGAGLAPEEEEWAVEAERKANRRRSFLFNKGNKKADAAAAPPLPEHFREKIALESGTVSPVEEVARPQSRSKRATRAPVAGETSAFDEDDDDDRAVPTSNTRSSFLSRGPKKEKAPKPPKEPKEPFSFKKKMSHLMTME
ncbi:unnamed protein product [Sympodiomycopsis kandeliae]